jgi:hypothetical protein
MSNPIFVRVKVPAFKKIPGGQDFIGQATTLDIKDNLLMDSIYISVFQAIPTRPPAGPIFEEGLTLKFSVEENNGVNPSNLDVGIIDRMPLKTLNFAEPVVLQKGKLRLLFENTSQFHLTLDIVLNCKKPP